MKIFAIFVLISSLFIQLNTFGCGTLSTVAYNSYHENPFGYVEYLPCNFDTTGETKYPILFWFSGLKYAGDGSDTSLTNQILNHNINAWLQKNDIPFIVFSPQSNNGFWEGSPLRTLTFYNWVEANYSLFIDPIQIHVAGWSAGGYGIASLIPDVPHVSTFTFMSTNTTDAYNYYEDIIDNKQYVWIHHGLLDESPNHLNSVLTFYESLYDADSSRVRLTVYSELAHSTWNQVYNHRGRATKKETGTYISNEKNYPYFNWTVENKTWYDWMLSKGHNEVIASKKKDVAELTLTLSPNPLTGNNTIFIQSDKIDLSLLTVFIHTNMGEQITADISHLTPSSIEINTLNLTSGTYFATIQEKDRKKVVKFIIQ